MKKVKIQLIIEKECDLPQNYTENDLLKESKKIKKILDMGYHVEVKIIEENNQSSH
jgi:hypothetical protein